MMSATSTTGTLSFTSDDNDDVASPKEHGGDDNVVYWMGYDEKNHQPAKIFFHPNDIQAQPPTQGHIDILIQRMHGSRSQKLKDEDYRKIITTLMYLIF